VGEQVSEALRSELEREVKNLVRTGKFILGARKSLKALLLGKAKAVVVADKILPTIEADVLHYAKLGGVPVIKFPGTSYELGLVCGRQHPVSVIAVLDFGESKLSEVGEAV
jgi:large subunit ribosomal protein L30e